MKIFIFENTYNLEKQIIFSKSIFYIHDIYFTLRVFYAYFTLSNKINFILKCIKIRGPIINKSINIKKEQHCEVIISNEIFARSKFLNRNMYQTILENINKSTDLIDLISRSKRLRRLIFFIVKTSQVDSNVNEKYA